MKMKKILVIIGVLFLLTGCTESSSKKEDTKNQPEGKYQTLKIKLDVKNKDILDQTYLVFILPEGLKETEAGKATQTYTQKLETNLEGEVEIPLSFNFNLESALKKYETDLSKLEVIITTQEDTYMRNPLNDQTFIEFVKNRDEDTKEEFPYLSVVETKNIDIIDKYPKGVISLTFPDATFVIKLEFEKDFKPSSSYSVSIYKPDPRSKDGIGIVRLGRLDREFQYWDTPFFEADKLSSWNGYIIIEDTNNKRIFYKDYPKTLTFDKNGKCNQGDIVKIKMPS